jgi:hypothetical protein
LEQGKQVAFKNIYHDNVEYQSNDGVSILGERKYSAQMIAKDNDHRTYIDSSEKSKAPLHEI